jgi:hypothetical protein
VGGRSHPFGRGGAGSLPGERHGKGKDAMAEQSHGVVLELKQNLDFERRSWTVERVSWVVIAVVTVAALAGLLGPGPLSHTTTGEPSGQLWLEYSRFGRLRAPSTLRVHVTANAGQPTPLRVWLSRNYLERVQVEQVTPQPEQVEAGPEQLTYAFPIAESSRSTAITLSLKMDRFGRQRGCIGMVDGPSLCFQQFIYP